MLNVRRTAPWLGLLGLLSTAACKDGGGPPGAPPGEDEDAETPLEDAGEDASDAGLDAAEDANVDYDAAISECQGSKLEFRVANGEGRSFTSVMQGNRTHLVYMVPNSGWSYGDAKSQGLAYVVFDTTNEPPAAMDLVNVQESFNTRDPALSLRSVNNTPQLDLFYTANNNGAWDLFYKDVTAAAEPQAQTNNPARNEFSAAAAPFAGASAVVFSDELGENSPGSVMLLKAPGTTPVTLLSASDKRADHLALLGPSGDNQGAYAFVSSLDASSGKSGIYSQPISSTGEAEGQLKQLSTLVGGRSQVAMARARSGSTAALIYTEAPGGTVHQLRFRQLNSLGVVSDSVRNLTSGNQNLHDIAIAPYSQGYVIAYRRVGGVGGAEASINLLFVDEQGNTAGTRLVQNASGSATGLSVHVANDGRIVVLWSDTARVTTGMQTETELRVRAARLNCAP